MGLKIRGSRFKTRWLLFHILSAVLYLLPYYALAEERIVTLEDAYRMSVGKHEVVKIAGEALFQAKANLGKATSLLLPTITAEGNFRKYNELKRASGFLIQPDDSINFDLRLSQPIYNGGRDWSVRRQAKMTVEEKRLGFEATREVVLLETTRAYFGVLKAEKGLEIKEAALRRAKEWGKAASSRFRVGEVTKSVVLRAEAEIAGAEAERTEAARGLIDAKDVLKRLVGIKDDIKVVEPPMKSAHTEGIEDLINIAFGARRDYKQSTIGQKVALEGIRYAKGNFLPSLKLEGVYSWRDQDPTTTFFQEETIYGVLVLTYPLFEGGLRKAELTEARSRLREAELRRIGLKWDIEIEVRSAFNNMETLNAVIKSYGKQVAFAEENYIMVFKQFKYGLAINVDVIDADTTLISAQSGLMNAKYDLQVAIMELKYMTGTLLNELEGVIKGRSNNVSGAKTSGN
jgi:outer membrane protein